MIRHSLMNAAAFISGLRLFLLYEKPNFAMILNLESIYLPPKLSGLCLIKILR
jgi:hypothetical protein